METGIYLKVCTLALSKKAFLAVMTCRFSITLVQKNIPLYLSQTGAEKHESEF